LEAVISRWYRGSVIIIKQLRPGTVIKDEAIPALLRRAKQPTFVTINHTDLYSTHDKLIHILGWPL
jgi:predicted GTPase